MSDSTADFAALAQTLSQSSDYRVLRRLKPREITRPADNPDHRIGVVLDVETTGLDTAKDEIIELGMVDDIIKDKENSRRKMLEQAAGITIYKTRKKEAKNKRKTTKKNFFCSRNEIAEEKLYFKEHNFESPILIV